MATTMLWGMLLMALAFWMYSIAMSAVPGAGDHPRTRTPRQLGGRAAGDAAMNWGSASEFFAMGGYGLYVWGSFGVTAAALLIGSPARQETARRHPPPACAGNLPPISGTRSRS